MVLTGCTKYSIYLAGNSQRYFTGYTHDLSLDAAYLSAQGYHSFFLLTRPMAAGKAIPLFERISREGRLWGTFFQGPLAAVLESKVKALKLGACQLGIPLDMIFLKEMGGLALGPLPLDEQVAGLEEALRGRILFLPEIERLLVRKNGCSAGETEDLLQIMCLQNRCVRLPGIKAVGRKKFICCRCGQSEGVVPIPCASCGETCYHCETCLSMGESRFCQVIYAVARNRESCRLPVKDIEPRMFVTLSPAQEKASNLLRQFVLQPEQKEKLVWAACGAGKTEVTFRAIAEALNRSQKVLFAIPRKDTVEELVVRIRRAFPRIPVACLHGASREKYLDADIVVATTHQAMRFYSNFDLVILDEIDAYPYSISPMLQTCIVRARTRGGKIIYMTATPSREMVARYNRGELACVWIPARHHGYPLPEPEVVLEKRLALLELGNTIPESIIKIIHETLEGDLAQLLIFVPSIERGMKVSEALRRRLRLPPFNDFAGSWVQFLHSREENRQKRLEDFRKGQYPILVTTTVCERGLTLPKVNVLVLFADTQGVFDASALIQMAGRSGRTLEYPGGKVWFAASRCSKEMKTACGRIKKMNQQAYDMGFLRPETLKKPCGTGKC